MGHPISAVWCVVFTEMGTIVGADSNNVARFAGQNAGKCCRVPSERIGKQIAEAHDPIDAVELTQPLRKLSRNLCRA